MWDLTGQYGTIQDSGLYGNVRNHTGPSETRQDYTGAYETIRNHTKETIGDHTGT